MADPPATPAATPTAAPGTWLTLSETSSRLGWHLNKVKSAVRRGRLQARKNNAGNRLVLVPATLLEAASDDTADVATGMAEDDVSGDATAALLEALGNARERAARADGRAEALLAAVSELRETHAAERSRLEQLLAVERTRADRLEAALLEARKPTLLRLLEAFRRR
jgi:septal ring factor EnvC (AmiA/AmiB activator)